MGNLEKMKFYSALTTNLSNFFSIKVEFLFFADFIKSQWK